MKVLKRAVLLVPGISKLPITVVINLNVDVYVYKKNYSHVSLFIHLLYKLKVSGSESSST